MRTRPGNASNTRCRQGSAIASNAAGESMPGMSSSTSTPSGSRRRASCARRKATTVSAKISSAAAVARGSSAVASSSGSTPSTCAAIAIGPRAATKWMRCGSGSSPCSSSSIRRSTSGIRPSVSGSGRGSFGHSSTGSSRWRIPGGWSGRQTTRAPNALGSFAMPYSTQNPGRNTTSGKRASSFR